MAPPARSNPAQRLLAILQRFNEAVTTHGDHGYDTVWVQTLGVPADRLTVSVAAAFGLIADIDRAVETTDDPSIARSTRRWMGDWASAFVPNSSGRQQGLTATVSEDALLALASVASHLRDNLPEGNVPDVEASHALRDQVRELIDRLRHDETVPEEMRVILIDRLNDMAWALDHVEITGARGIRTAMDRLVMGYADCFKASDEPPTMQATEEEAAAAEAQDGRMPVWAKIVAILSAANVIAGAPGAWYTTWEAGRALSPHIDTALRALGAAAGGS